MNYILGRHCVTLDNADTPRRSKAAAAARMTTSITYIVRQTSSTIILRRTVTILPPTADGWTWSFDSDAEFQYGLIELLRFITLYYVKTIKCAVT